MKNMSDRPRGEAVTDRASEAESYLLAEREPFVASAIACADAVTAGWDGASATDRETVVGPLAERLATAGVLDAAPEVLAGTVEAIGGRAGAEPVAAPPYVAVTSVGPVLRASLDDERLVITLRLFAVERDGTTRYVRGTDEPAEVVDVELR